MSSVYRVTPSNGAPVLRSYSGPTRATKRAAEEFREGVVSVELV